MKVRTTRDIQSDIDAAAEERSYWRAMRAALIGDHTKALMETVRKRMAICAESYIKAYDNCAPTDSIQIARAQEGRKVLLNILLEFDVEECNKGIELTDAAIKRLTDELAKASKGEVLSPYSLTKEKG